MVQVINTMIADDEYFCHNRKNLPLPIQMLRNQFFIAVLKFALHFKHLKKDEPHSLSISEIIYSARRGYLNT